MLQSRTDLIDTSEKAELSFCIDSSFINKLHVTY